MKLRSAVLDAREDAGHSDASASAVLPTVQRPRPAAGTTWDKRLGCVLWPLGLLLLLLVLDTARRHALTLLVCAFRGTLAALHAADELRCVSLRRAIFPAATTVEGAGGGATGWLSAAHNRAALSDWYAAVADMVGWKLADWEIALRMLGRRKARAKRRLLDGVLVLTRCLAL